MRESLQALLAEAVDYAAHGLAAHDHRVKQAATVLSSHVFQDLHLSGLRIDLDQSCVNEHRVRVGAVVEPLLVGVVGSRPAPAVGGLESQVGARHSGTVHPPRPLGHGLLGERARRRAGFLTHGQQPVSEVAC